MNEKMADLLEVAEQNRYVSMRERGGKAYAIMPLLFTQAIIVFSNKYFVDDRWCYHSFEDAEKALDGWQARDFEGEPDGWHRHPSTGRRRKDGVEYVQE